MKLSLPKKFKKAFSLVPSFVRKHLFRSMVDLQVPPPAEIVVKLAESKEELEQAYKLLHDVFVVGGCGTILHYGSETWTSSVYLPLVIKGQIP